MKKQRVFQNVKRKGTESGFFAKNLGAVLLLLFLLPYLITFGMGNLWREEARESLAVKKQLQESRCSVVNKTALGEETIPLELYVADLLSRLMDSDSPLEALKAQAVLLRTNLLYGAGEVTEVSDEEYGKRQIPKACILAAAETKGICLEYDGKPAYGAYCRVSSGRTRTASEFLTKESYPYLVGVPCGRDFLSEEYMTTVSFDRKEFEEIWAQVSETGKEETELLFAGSVSENSVEQEKGELVLLRDSAGYVTLVKYKGRQAAGEAFRYALQLPSAHFELEKKGEEYIVSVKGAGHGLGMSQFAACEMAKEGDSYVDILRYFFQNINLTKIE